MNKENKEYDAIVIGSGIGGLTTAVLLSKMYGKKVLVLEQHFIPGGQTHEFTRINNGNKYNWDIGLHSLSGMNKGSALRMFFDFITDNKIAFQKLPHEFDTFIFPEFTFKQPANKEEFKQKLVKKFPKEEKAIHQYFKDIEKATKWQIFNVLGNAFPTLLKPVMKLIGASSKKLALSTTKKYFDNRFEDEKIKALLSYTWGMSGLPPSKSAFTMDALPANAYLEGTHYPIGGSGEIAKAMIPIIEKNGGEVLVRKNVTEVIVENKKAIGVKSINKNGETEVYFADKIISDTGAINTYEKLYPKGFSIPDFSQFNDLENHFGGIILYVGLKESPEKLGLKGEDLRIYKTYDHDINGLYHETPKSIEDIEIKFASISFASLNNPKAETHTAQITSAVPYKLFEKWKNQDWRNRDKDYFEVKEIIAKKILKYVEKSLPGFEALVDYQELSTPLTMEYFTKWEGNKFYGIPPSPERYKHKYLTPKTTIKNLYLTGTDVLSSGVMGAALGGALTVSVLQGGFLELFRIIRAVMLSRKYA